MQKMSCKNGEQIPLIYQRAKGHSETNGNSLAYSSSLIWSIALYKIYVLQCLVLSQTLYYWEDGFM